MEDIRIMRQTTVKTDTVVIGAAAVQVVPYNKRRVALKIYNPTATAFFVGIDNAIAVNINIGVTIASGPFSVNIQQDGAMCFGPYWIIAAGAGVATIIETLLEGE